MKTYNNKIAFIGTLLFLMGCVEPFDAPVRNEDVGFLVVDGYVNTTDHQATVTLSRAIPLSSPSFYPSVLNATVSIENSEGSKIPLIQTGNGVYMTTSNSLVTGKDYRLLIDVDGKKYESAFVTAKQRAGIDSLTWDTDDEGVNVRLSTHDFTGNSRYFRWDLKETWEYHSAFSSNFELKNGIPELRKFNERINTCYRSDASGVITTANTLGFTENKLSGHPILFIEKLSWKIEYLYSVEVTQYSLSKEGYDYWEQLRITSQTLGGLFDPQPARIKGNLYRVGESDEPVIGYFDAGEISKGRLFINNRELPATFQRYARDPNCEELFADPMEATRLSGSLITSAVYEGIALIGYNYTTVECADCRVKGGVLAKPDFWP